MVWNAFTGGPGWEPWRELDRVQAELNRLCSDFTGQGASEFPLIEVWTGADALLLQARLPGLAPADIELTVAADTLTLKGTRPGPEASAGESYRRQEREAGTFVRRIQLPFAVEGEQVRAQFKNGVLEVKLPRAASDRPRKINVETA